MAMTILVHWEHEAAQAKAFASLLPKTIEAIERWVTVPDKMQEDRFGFYYDIVTQGIKTDVYHKVLRPATLRLGAMKALQDAPLIWGGFDQELTQIFTNIGGVQMGGHAVHQPGAWYPTTLDLMVQLAWFREVMFA
jgi:hypothetical protein